MSPDVAHFLLHLLGRQTLETGADDFESVALLVIKAKAELTATLGAEPPA